MVTQCPSCFTRFIVSPKQLKAYDGQVRCGQCQHVFIAADYAIEQTPPNDFIAEPNQADKPSFNSLFWGLSAGLLLLVFFQLLFFLRNDICKQWPALRPTFVDACHLFACTMTLPRHIELLAIDDTELIKDEAHEGNLKFNYLITNNASYTQDLPSLELTLTDNLDRPLIRRQFTPKEYLLNDQSKVLDGLRGNEEIHLSLNLKVTNPAVVGFRAFLVY
jgi:predicted Zn finger-like uncharacterized protein